MCRRQKFGEFWAKALQKNNEHQFEKENHQQEMAEEER